MKKGGHFIIPVNPEVELLQRLQQIGTSLAASAIDVYLKSVK